MKILETDRLILRTWVDADLESMFAIKRLLKSKDFYQLFCSNIFEY